MFLQDEKRITQSAERSEIIIAEAEETMRILLSDIFEKMQDWKWQQVSVKGTCSLDMMQTQTYLN